MQQRALAGVGRPHHGGERAAPVAQRHPGQRVHVVARAAIGLADIVQAERILAGVYGDDELLDEIEAYFDLPSTADSSSAGPRIST